MVILVHTWLVEADTVNFGNKELFDKEQIGKY